MIDKYIRKVDYVICEGTNVKRPDATSQSEHDLQKQSEILGEGETSKPKKKKVLPS